MSGDPYIHRLKNAVVNQLRTLTIIRAQSYKRVFMQDGKIHRDGEIVLADLRNLAFGNSTTFHPDPYIAARRAGRREVWLRIAQHLNLDEEQVQKLVELDDGN